MSMLQVPRSQSPRSQRSHLLFSCARVTRSKLQAPCRATAARAAIARKSRAASAQSIAGSQRPTATASEAVRCHAFGQLQRLRGLSGYRLLPSRRKGRAGIPQQEAGLVNT